MRLTISPVRRRSSSIVAVLLAVSAVASGPAPATAGPRPIAAPGYGTGDDGEGGSKTLSDQLDAASRGYLDARAALAASQQRQQEGTARLKTIETELAPPQAVIDAIVGQAYRVGRLGPISALLTAPDSASLLDRTEVLESMAVRQDAALRDLKNAHDQQLQAKQEIDATIRDQQKQLNLMAQRKIQAETALKAAGGGADIGAPGGGGSSAVAEPAPRNSAGGFSPESCTVNDPTTNGCITPRMLHAMQQAQAAGFTHFVACFRHQSFGEHPKGRACDFAADKGGFGGVATGASKDYGNRLANYFIANSDRLGVLYVIWFRRIWLPSSGWKAYTRGNGDPSSDHTNHVHLSVV